MPTPPLTANDPRVIEAVAAWDATPDPRHIAHVADASGVDRMTFRRRLKVGLAARDEDPAIRSARAAIGTNMTPALAWAKTAKPDENGMTYSVMLKPDARGDDLDRIRDAFEGLTPAPEIEPPEHAQADLMNLLPLFDVHLSMLAWGDETGESYDTDLAAKRLRSGALKCLSTSPAAGLCVVLIGGDFTHQNDQTNQTPRSKHQLDVDGRHFRTTEVAIQVLADVIETALARHDRVTVRAIPGNHDPMTSIILTFALRERYRENPRVDVIKDPSEFFAFTFGRVMLAAHHGDKAKADRLVMHMADEWPEMWGATRHRYYWTGHMHHHKSADIGGVKWEQLQAIAPRDAYAASHSYSARASMSVVTYHREHGEIGRVRWPFMA